MSVRHHEHAFARLTADQLAQWRGLGTAEISDCLDRAQAMFGAIGPLRPGMALVGQARTVTCMVADNSALHAAVNLAEPGELPGCPGDRLEGLLGHGALSVHA